MERKAIYKTISIFAVLLSVILFVTAPCYALQNHSSSESEHLIHISGTLSVSSAEDKSTLIEPEDITFSEDGEKITKTFQLPLDANTDVIIEEPFPQNNAVYRFAYQEIMQSGEELTVDVTYVKESYTPPVFYRLDWPFILSGIVFGGFIAIGTHIYDVCESIDAWANLNILLKKNAYKQTTNRIVSANDIIFLALFLFLSASLGYAVGRVLVCSDMDSINNDTIKQEIVETIISKDENPSSFIKEIFKQEGTYFEFEDWKKLQIPSEENGLEGTENKYKYTITYTKTSQYYKLFDFIPLLITLIAVEITVYITISATILLFDDKIVEWHTEKLKSKCSKD